MEIIKKYLVIMLFITIIMNALLSTKSFADTEENPLFSQSKTDYNEIQTPEDVNKYLNTGEAEGSSNETRPTNTDKETPISQTHDRDTNLQSEQSSFFAVQIANIIKVIPKVLQTIMSQCVGTNAATENLFTIQNLLMGKYELFDINIFNKNVETEAASEISKKIKESVSIWYGSIKNLAIIVSFVILLYIAIRMAISTVSDEKAKYKKMLISWFTGFIFIFVLHYLILFLITLSDYLVKLLSSLAPTSQVPFEYAVMKRIFSAEVSGWDAILQAILYFMLVWYQLKFFFIYLKRVISNAFLLLIAPLITVTYAADRANDLKAKAIKSWLQEIITNIFIQPMHLLMFLVLLYSAGAIAEQYPIVAILFMFGLSKAEKMLRGLFKLEGSTIKGIDEGTSFTSIVKKL